MSKKLIPAIVIAIVAIVIVLLVGKKAPVSTETPVDTSAETATTTVAKPSKPVKKPTTTAPVTAPTTPETPAEEPAEEPVAEPKTVTETFYVSDTTATPKVLEVNKGDTVKVTFVGDPRNNYHNGLEFRSDVMSPVKVMNNQSVMISFMAEESFSFTPYWPGSDTPKPYTVDIVVN